MHFSGTATSFPLFHAVCTAGSAQRQARGCHERQHIFPFKFLLKTKREEGREGEGRKTHPVVPYWEGLVVADVLCMLNELVLHLHMWRCVSAFRGDDEEFFGGGAAERHLLFSCRTGRRASEFGSEKDSAALAPQLTALPHVFFDSSFQKAQKGDPPTVLDLDSDSPMSCT
ncbi:hypothetical protein DFH07DRAFT_770680 [Mycena maculata]|uniref:Uncharacterized protein n=1 Tax=Mycena maculata TaxID=230809 RepID=A0AAD7JIE2_9AGAR|nr:hypothetical protein DFH07DRAFT_770680 [Mycena maculata]